MTAQLLDIRAVSKQFGGNVAVSSVSFSVESGQIVGLIGPNGSGKTTLLRIASLYEHPSAGVVEVLGERLGRTDVRSLRTRIAFSSPAMAARLEPRMTALEVVMTGIHAALAPWWHRYTEADRALKSGGTADVIMPTLIAAIAA